MRRGLIQGQSNGSSEGVLGTEVETRKSVHETIGLPSLTEVLLSGPLIVGLQVLRPCLPFESVLINVAVFTNRDGLTRSNRPWAA